MSEVQTGIKAGRLHQGVLRVNRWAGRGGGERVGFAACCTAHVVGGASLMVGAARLHVQCWTTALVLWVCTLACGGRLHLWMCHFLLLHLWQLIASASGPE